MDSVYVVTVYGQLAGVYTSYAKAEERVKELRGNWGDPPSVTWEYVALDKDVATLYDRQKGEDDG